MSSLYSRIQVAFYTASYEYHENKYYRFLIFVEFTGIGNFMYSLIPYKHVDFTLSGLFLTDDDVRWCNSLESL